MWVTKKRLEELRREAREEGITEGYNYGLQMNLTEVINREALLMSRPIDKLIDEVETFLQEV